MSKRLYIGNLPYTTTIPELEEMFGAEPGSATIPTDGDRSKGFGFVDVPDEKAEALIAEMNGKEFGGRPLVVNEARPRTERPRDGGGSGGSSWNR